MVKFNKTSDYTVSGNDSLFFDTNVWLHIYGPIAKTRTKEQQEYSSILRQALSRNAVIFITSQVISEYINVVLRMGFKSWKSQTGEINAQYKDDYRPTQHYLDTLQDAKDQVNTILATTIVQKLPDSFNSLSVDSIMNRMDSFCDYNDSYFIALCEKGTMTMVSDDADMKKIDCNISLISFK